MNAYNHTRAPELERIKTLIANEQLDTHADSLEADQLALKLARDGRAEVKRSWFHAMIAAYPLDRATGLQFMRLAEAYLRTPDARSQMDLIEDRFGETAPEPPVPGVRHPAVFAAYMGLKVFHTLHRTPVFSWIRGLFQGLIRTTCRLGLQLMGREFVMSQTIDAAVAKSHAQSSMQRYSFDMLGEGAVTEADAERYFERYADALDALAIAGDTVAKKDGISVKLSALHPAYDIWHWESAKPVLLARMKALCVVAKEKQVGLNIDAEEYARLDLGIEIVKTLRADSELQGWTGLGIVIQAYHCRAYEVLGDLLAFLDQNQQQLMVRLVKGAYWDTEIKHAQEQGLTDFPVFTRKAHTDISYLACARRMLARVDVLYPQFATHNAKTMTDILAMASQFGVSADQFEFQRLYGMGGSLHAAMQEEGVQSRVYAPIGTYRDLLAYLVRRLLENAANTSFISQLANPSLQLSELVKSPLTVIRETPDVVRPQTGAELFLPRMNSQGFRIDEVQSVLELHQQIRAYTPSFTGRDVAVCEPATNRLIGHYDVDTAESIAEKWRLGQDAAKAWGARTDRASYLLEVARLYEAHHVELMHVLQREAGKTLLDAIGEIREAIDFLRYYAAQPEAAVVSSGRMVVCISPWNFPLAIFTGQIAAAVATGQAVVAKPAEQTSLTAQLAVRLWSTVLPKHVVQLVMGEGAEVGPMLLAQPEISTVAFTGSTETARQIQKALADSDNFAARFIAETGGLNACIADSTALPERLVRDVVTSAFYSAGQRCSACRVLLVQREIYADVQAMLIGAMQTLVVGDPQSLDTDVGPVIDADARDQLLSYIETRRADVLYQTQAPSEGYFVPATLIEIDSLDQIQREQFGPVLHIMSYAREDLESQVDALMAKGYGLTAAIQSRNERFIQTVSARLRVGNLYVNRNQVGAVVGSQPFGGEGLSGTGPKAGGPRYLSAFQAEPSTRTSEGDSLPLTESEDPLMRDQLERALDLQARQLTAQAIRHEDCPGPTGELNRLSEYPRGVWLALGASAAPLVDEALGFNNRVIWLSETDVTKRTDERLTLLLCQEITLDWLSSLAFDGVLVATTADCLQSIAQKLTERTGPLIPVVTQPGSGSQLTCERHLCIDTTASGGNPGLLLSAAQ